jgi:signal transduction histidine kinase
MHELGKADGLDIGASRQRTFAKTADGRFLFAGIEGLAIVDPERFEFWEFVPPVIATELKIDGLTRPLAELSGGLKLDPEQENFSIEFAALDYSAPMKNRFAYRLLGAEADWIETDAAHRNASYGGLWPGDYTLEVRGSGRSGEWSRHQLRIPITVLPAFWQTGWFALLVSLGVIVAAWGGLRWRTARLSAEARRLQSLVDARTADIRATLEKLTQAQQQLVQQEKMAALGTLTAGVAHEINNPTNFADGAVQNLQSEHQQLHDFLRHLAGDDAPPEILAAIAERFTHLDEMTATAREGHERIKRIVRDLRQFTRLDEADRKAVPIAEPIQSTVNLVRTRFDRIRFELDLKINPNIDCQPAKLGQVFMNLIMNACEAIGERKDGRAGVVRIATTIVGAEVAIEIADNGAGMDETTLQRVFEPFFTTKAVGAGTGLGLAIVFGIVKDHGGSIDVNSTPDVGTRFCVRLPLVNAPALGLAGAPA